MNYQLYNGDCLEKMANIADKSVDLILCDLPYGTTACSWDTVIPFDQLWKHYLRISKDTTPIVLFGAQPFTTSIIMSKFDMFRYCWIWLKERGTGFAISKKQPLRMTEDIVVFYKSTPYYNSVGEKLNTPYSHLLPVSKSESVPISGSGYNEKNERILAHYTHSTKNNVIKIARENNRKTIHPTQKPVKLISFLIDTYTKEGDLVLDNCMGSGTTGVSCVQLNRDFIGIEKDSIIFHKAKSRIDSEFNTYKKIQEFENNLFGLIYEEKTDEKTSIAHD